MPKKTNKVEPLWQWPGTKKSLELEEWWFEDCPDDELEHCLAYEYGRHIHKVVWDYQEDKRLKFKYGGNDIRENGIWYSYINLYECSDEPVCSDEPKSSDEPVDQFGIAAPSGFPEKPFQTVDRSKLDKEKFQRSLPVRISPYDSTKRLKGNFAVQINWAYSNKLILAGVKKWLEKCDRPKPKKVQGLGPGRTARSKLKKLGVYRLIKFFENVDTAMEYVENESIKHLPFALPNKWDEAKKEVETQIQELNFQSGFWHPELELLPKEYFRTTPYWDAYFKALSRVSSQERP
jgi:hypothetical protein